MDLYIVFVDHLSFRSLSLRLLLSINAGWNLLYNIGRHINEYFKFVYHGVVRMLRLYMDLWYAHLCRVQYFERVLVHDFAASKAYSNCNWTARKIRQNMT